MLNMSQFGKTASDSDSRPLSCTKYSSDGKLIATGSLSCLINIYNEKDLNWVDTFRGHSERITSLCWHPSYTTNTLLCSSSADGSCILWDCKKNMQEKSSNNSDAMDVVAVESPSQSPSPMVGVLKGHSGIVSDCKFHPSGEYIVSCSQDYTWRMWNIESTSTSEVVTGKELLLQDGHNKGISAIAVHPDGSIVATGDVVGNILLWDVRSGQMIQLFQGHIKKISKLEFHPNGLELVSGCIDHMVRIWDLRKKKCTRCLPAHSNCISHVGYSNSGEILITSSFDGDVKIWRSRDNLLLKTLSASSNVNKFMPTPNQPIGSGISNNNAGKIMSCDINPIDEKHIVSVSYDRSIKVWAHKDEY